MILFGLSLCTLVTFAFMYKGEYVECLNDTDCIVNFPENDNNYCYVGTCTNRCPPGYNQSSTEDDFLFHCECDKENGLVPDGNFTGAFVNINKCRCDKTYCLVTVTARGIGYTDGLIPHGAPPNCKAVQDEIPPVLTQFSFYLVLVTMGIYLLIHCRSGSSVLYDFHRYYGLYVFGSVLVIVFVQTVYPFTVGFTRSMTFGIVAHNSMEWNILIRIQYGKTAYVRNSANIVLVCYFVIMLLAMSLLPLEPLLYFSMVQGGFLDWAFVCFILAAQTTVEKSVDLPYYYHQGCKNKYARFQFWFGMGAIFHLLSVEILFAGFLLNNAQLIGLGGFFLLPMFFFYTIWVFGQGRIMIFCGPRVFVQYEKNDESRESKQSYKIVPYTNLTRVVDILWRRFIGAGYQPIELLPVQKQVAIDKEDPDPRFGVYEVEDPELFKFGIDDTCCGCTCPRIPCCCDNYIPVYWVIAFVLISINAGVLMLLPELISTEGCNTGYDYGAW